MGFLATVDRERRARRLRRALAGDFEMLSLPAIELSTPRRRRWLAFNDVSIHRLQGNRVADLGYSVGGDEVGRVRCDGLVVATPAGSTGYNLANGGPVMAWGVEGFVVSFIAPALADRARAGGCARRRVAVDNRSREEPVEVIGRRPADVACWRPARACGAVRRRTRDARAGARDDASTSRLRQKFGRLA